MNNEREALLNEGVHVFINQLGYVPNQDKQVVSDLPARQFEVIQFETGETVFTGAMDAVTDATSNRSVWRGDFSLFNINGKYRIITDTGAASFPFFIDPLIYHQLFQTATRFYYLQRCGTEIRDELTGLFHAPCHCGDAFIDPPVPGCHTVSTGGWHDAGDYGKYAATTTVTVALMLTLYELWPDRFTDGQLQIPESGNGRADLLDEALVGLRWLLTLQRPDGAIYRKLAATNWPGINTLPEADCQDRFLFGISSSDTAKFAATMSIAARVWQTIDPELTQEFSNAALKAWRFLKNHQENIWEQSEWDDRGSGPYYYADDSVDRIWAALEIAVLTGKTPDETDGLPKIKSHLPASIGWEDPSLLGYFHYARDPRSDQSLAQLTRKKITDLAEELLTHSLQSGYLYSIHFQEFKWASNKEGLARGITLALADYLSPNSSYRQTSVAQLHFILGLNPLSKSFVTGIGANPVLYPHHRWVVSSGQMVPGMLAGGPNNNSDSNIEPAHSGPLSYLDHTESFSSNEPAIDYNAALMFMAGVMMGSGF